MAPHSTEAKGLPQIQDGKINSALTPPKPGQTLSAALPHLKGGALREALFITTPGEAGKFIAGEAGCLSRVIKTRGITAN